MLKNFKFFSKGKRGYIFTAKLNKIRVVIKTNNPKSKAIGRMANEGKWLEILNKKGIGPKLLMYTDNFLMYEFIEGVFILDYLKNNRDVKPIILELIRQCRVMDELKVNKEEMGHPPKHVIVKRDRSVVLVDFERCHRTDKPQNVTQVFQYLMSKEMEQVLNLKGIALNQNELIKLLKEYKTDYSKEKYRKLIELI